MSVTREQVAVWFRQALGERPIWTPEDLLTMAANGQGTIWANPASALFMRFDEYPNGEKVVEVGPAGGRLDEIIESVPAIEAWARENGCTQAMVYAGRFGWTRALAPQGYEMFSTTLRKVL